MVCLHLLLSKKSEDEWGFFSLEAIADFFNQHSSQNL
jgi:hypothetical protein